MKKAVFCFKGRFFHTHEYFPLTWLCYATVIVCSHRCAHSTPLIEWRKKAKFHSMIQEKMRPVWCPSPWFHMWVNLSAYSSETPRTVITYQSHDANWLYAHGFSLCGWKLKVDIKQNKQTDKSKVVFIWSQANPIYCSTEREWLLDMKLKCLHSVWTDEVKLNAKCK